MRRNTYKSKRTKRTEITTRVMILVVFLALMSPFIYHKFLVTKSVTETKSLLIVSKGAPLAHDNGYNTKARHNSSADKSMPKYYVRANTSKLGIGKDTVDVDVSENFYNDIEVGTYHDFTVVTDTIFTGKKRVRIYY